jgi:hypothetical protein
MVKSATCVHVGARLLLCHWGFEFRPQPADAEIGLTGCLLLVIELLSGLDCIDRVPNWRILTRASHYD